MNKKASLSSGTATLIVAVLAVTAFIRGRAQILFLAGVFAIFFVWASVKFWIPALKIRHIRRSTKKIQRQAEREKQRAMFPDFPDPVPAVLLRHVNHRISAYLQSIYPDATWEWRTESPEQIAEKGGTGRIQIYGAADYDFADVTLTQDAEINFSLLKVVPIANVMNSSGNPNAIPQKTNPVDPQVWYENQGRTVLEALISDLNSRGHHSLTIRENGEIVIQQADTETVKGILDHLPEKVYWPRLSKVFEREGMASQITDGGFVLSW